MDTTIGLHPQHEAGNVHEGSRELDNKFPRPPTISGAYQHKQIPPLSMSLLPRGPDVQVPEPHSSDRR